MITITAPERNLAAAAHLGYLFVAVAMLLTFVSGWLLLPALLGLGLLSAVEMRAARASGFVREHQRQARRHHVLALLGGLALAAFAVWAGIFTWGIGTVMTAMAVPILGLIWMVPTVMAVSSAYQGQLFEYKLERRLVRSRQTPVVA